MPIKSNGAVATPAQTPAVAPKVDVAQTAPAPVAASLGKRAIDTGLPINGRDDRKSSYDDNKNRRILVQGITQAVVQSPIVAGLGFTNEKEIIALVKSVSRELIAFVDEESK